MAILEQETTRHRSKSITITVPKIGESTYERQTNGDFGYTRVMEGDTYASLVFWRTMRDEFDITFKEYYHEDEGWDLESTIIEEEQHFLSIDGEEISESEYWIERFMKNIAPRIEDRVVIETRSEVVEDKRDNFPPYNVILMGDRLTETLSTGVTVTIDDIDLKWGKVTVSVSLPWDSEDASLLTGDEVDRALRAMHDMIVDPLKAMESWDEEVYSVMCESTISATSHRSCDTDFLGPKFG